MYLHTVGPFYISCGDCEEQLFLKVDEDSHNQLVATDEFDNASKFSITRYDQGDEHFRLIYEPPVMPESGAAIRTVPSLFLCTSK